VSNLSESDYRALAAFRHHLRRFIAFSETAARKVDLEPRQHQLLLALRGLPVGADPSVQALADALVLKHHTVVELLDRLEAARLIRRDRAPDDRRRAQIALTQRGIDLLESLSDAHLDELRSLAPALIGALSSVLVATRRRAS
jgi:DNA-binding MarR family transcriptional regulator